MNKNIENLLKERKISLEIDFKPALTEEKIDSRILRDFEERDIDFIFKCKNDEKLNSMIVGEFHPFTREEAEKWVRGCMGEHDTYKFWAICTNDEKKSIVGWISLSQIDKQNNSVCQHGLVIGDNDYRDGSAMFEAMFLSMKYAFHVLDSHRVYGSCLSDHHTSPHLMNALGFNLEGRERDAVFKNGCYHDIYDYALLENDFERYMKEGRYEIPKLIKLFILSVKDKKE